MSGSMRRITLSDGRVYDVPDDNAVGFMQALDARGLHFSSDGAPPDGQSEDPSPTAPSTPPEAPQATPVGKGGTEPRNDRGFLAGLGDRIVSSPAYAAAYDALGGLTHGASAGFADDALEALGADSAAAELRSKWDDSRSRSPIAYTVGDIGGTMALPVGRALKAVGLAREGGLAANIANQALEGGTIGAARTYGDQADGEKDALAALAEGGEDALISGGIAGGLGGLGKSAGAIADRLDKSADLNRVAATGIYGAGLKRMMQNKGEDSVRELGRDIEEAGLHKGEGILGWLPQPAQTYADNASALRDDALERMGKAEAGISDLASPPTVSTTDLVGGLRSGAEDAASKWDPAGPAEGNFRNAFADRIADNSTGIEGTPETFIDWNNAVGQRRYVDKQIDWNRLGGKSNAPMEEAARREVAGNLRAATSDALDRGVDMGTVPSELSDAWKGARDDYSLAAAVQDPAIARVYQEFGNQKVSLPSMALAGGGLAAGGGVGGLAAAAAGQFMKYRGASALAGAERAGANVARFAGGAPNWLSQNAPFGQLSASLGGNNQHASAQDMDGDSALSAMGNQISQTQNDARGYLLPQAAMQLLRTNPQALGQYASQIAQAAGSDDTGAVGALLDKLSQTDPDFSTQVLPRLNAMTAEQ